MTDRLAIAVAQLDPTVGDIAGNLAKLGRARDEAARLGADLVVASELFVAGYPPEDLVLKPAFVAACQAAVREFARETATGPAVLLGTPWRQDGKLYNAAALLGRRRGRGAALQARPAQLRRLRREARVRRRSGPGPMPFRGVRLGVMVCEDMWSADATETLAESGAELLVVINGSPFESDKSRRAHESRRRPHQGKRPAAPLCQPGRRPGRTGVRRRLLRARCPMRAASSRRRPGARRWC